MKLDMALGVASAAAQIEGGGFSHNWDEWYKKGRIRDGANPARANDHLNRWKEDIDLMAEMGITMYRFSIEWVRIEPGRGKYDEAAVEWYRTLLAYMKSKGITPLLTLHHFTNPLWFESLGGFAAPANIPIFLGFVEYAVRRFGDLVDEYITINEPNVFAILGYFLGEYPPGIRSFWIAVRVLSVMATCHIQAYGLIHKLRREMGYAQTKVGFAHHARVFVPKSKYNLWHRFCTLFMDTMFQSLLVRACLLGRFNVLFTRYCGVKPGEYADFLGLNYYTRTTVSAMADGVREGVSVNDLGWEIYPEGIVLSAQEMYKLLKRPIYITENGTCDNNDSFRCRYIYDHLKALADSGLPVERYYHWCFTDNFEWNEGESARFGLVHIDYATQKRTVKKSGRFFSAIIQNKGISSTLYDEFVAPQEYHL
ncbi:MAG: family 1 glycosylhydrolase [Treponema sp.]|jgi:beta-glucosidase|nr:family 1 glycosylhydrolase [Treponema sp.]